MTGAAEIVDAIRSQNWKNGGVHALDREEAILLLETFIEKSVIEAEMKLTKQLID